MNNPIGGKWSLLRHAVLTVVLPMTLAMAAEKTEDRWWPRQVLPEAVLRATIPAGASSRLALEMMLQSIAGLAAKSVNEGGGREMVWVGTGNADLDNWFARLRAAHPNLEQPGEWEPWALLDRFAKRGIVKGYILYRLDPSRGDYNAHRPGMDTSVNVATSLAGLLEGIIVDESLEKEAQAHGLKRLMDVRGQTQKWCFETYRGQFNRTMLCTQDPRKPHVRDLAIAQKAFTLFGPDETMPAIMAWLEPLSPILGWNGGDEFACTDLSTRFGHIQTATDWCMNLPVLMSGSENAETVKLKDFDPGAIDWNDKRSAVSFVETDGDNVQWLQGNFFRNNSAYWSNPDRGKIPFGWSCCFAHLTQLCPQAIDYAEATRTPLDSFIEWGGGYYYPDRFGLARKDRWQLLARQSQRTWALMQKSNTRLIGFNFWRYDSGDARKACEVIAAPTDGLLAILIFQYSPYEGGAGKTFWVKDRNGIEVPAITARYSIWEHANERPRAGTPAKIAREIRETVEQARLRETPRYDWVITHAWSYFKKAPGADESAENLPQANAPAAGGVRGYTPVTWCAERLPASIRVVQPEELAWRIRMSHDPDQTRRFMERFSAKK